MNSKMIRKTAAAAGVLLTLAAALLILSRTAQNSVQTTQQLPEIDDRAVYVECETGKPVEVRIHAKESFAVSGFPVLLVNVSKESRGTLQVRLTDDSADILMDQAVPIATITPGEWFVISGHVTFEAGRDYRLIFAADESEPYFMQVLKGAEEALPFEQEVSKNGEIQECGVSLGVNRVMQTAVTYGDIFYYSVPICILAAVFLLVGIWLGYREMWERFKKLSMVQWVRDQGITRFGSDLFLLLLFGAVCISIYSRAYLEGVYISADSAGYLREAVSLFKGQGFCYDGLAGYQTWFANWPVLYPCMIAFVMLLTGANAYLASKIAAMAVIGFILLILRLFFKKDAWIYALCITNIGFLNLAYYTWSEIPFILFLLCFGLVLSQILRREAPGRRWYVLLGISGLGCFLTRYFGIYVWIVAGFYILCLLLVYRKEKRGSDLKKALGLTVTAGISGAASMAYLLVNKRMNGMASGVSRTMWWDDYRRLTDDLIESLLTEVFHVFSLQVPELIEGFPFSIKVWVILLIGAGLFWLIFRNCKHFSTESVMIVMALAYYGIFIVIRYFSSMDTFYFRFFEPATFLLCIGLIGLILPHVRGKQPFQYFAVFAAALTVLAVSAIFANGGVSSKNGYYSLLTRQWEDHYAEIPEKSVIIFSDIDFRASWYRPDVVEGIIRPEDTLESIKDTYYGSNFLCIKAEFAKAVVESGEYEDRVQGWLAKGIDMLSENREYVVLSLR